MHCPEWYEKREFGWKFLGEIILSDVKEIVKCLIEMSKRKDDIRMELL